MTTVHWHLFDAFSQLCNTISAAEKKYQTQGLYIGQVLHHLSYAFNIFKKVIDEPVHKKYKQLFK